MANDLSGQQVGTQRRTHTSQPKANVLTGRSKFPMSYVFPNTSRYGEISPFYYQHVKGDDIVPLQSEHEIRTFTLASPMLSDIQMQKTYAFIPMEAIYPINWHRMQINPDKGEDVPDDTRFNFNELIQRLSNFVGSMKSVIANSGNNSFYNNTLSITAYMRSIFLLESFFSNGSLLAQFNIHLSDFVKYYPDGDTLGESKSFDYYFDNVFVPFLKVINPVIMLDGEDGNPVYFRGGDTYTTAHEPGDESVTVPWHRFLDICRTNRFRVFARLGLPVDGDLDFYTHVSYLHLDFQPWMVDYPLNLEIIAAYQMACWQFFTDSKIDYVWSAERYRAALSSILYKGFTQQTLQYPFFYEQNGEMIQYDVFSAKTLQMITEEFDWSHLMAGQTSYQYYEFVFDFFSMLLTHRNSLRYGDYFVSSRTRPYGIGEVTIDQSQGYISVIDITKKIQIQRFLNSVAWSGQKAAEYAKNVLGIDKPQQVDNTQPSFIANQYFPVTGFEVENTGDGQREANSVTTLIKTKQSRFAFEFEPSNQGIILGLRSYDCPRVYSKTFDRMHMAYDRYDDFIPEMQFIGDQEIKKIEISSYNDPDSIFAYTLRYMPMKQRYNYAAGGFIENLNSWCMITDNVDGNPLVDHIDPEYIRSSPSEFDRFYSSLTGYSLASYFHFIHVDRNYQELTRDMVYAPEPLK